MSLGDEYAVAILDADASLASQVKIYLRLFRQEPENHASPSPCRGQGRSLEVYYCSAWMLWVSTAYSNLSLQNCLSAKDGQPVHPVYLFNDMQMSGKRWTTGRLNNGLAL
jgi:hypothetical protein